MSPLPALPSVHCRSRIALQAAVRGVWTAVSRLVRCEQLRLCAQFRLSIAHTTPMIAMQLYHLAYCLEAGLPALLDSRPQLQFMLFCLCGPVVTCATQG